MRFLLKKKYIITTVLVGFFFVGVSFKNDFFEIAKQIEIFTTTFKTINTNYVDPTNPGDLMDKAIKNMLQELDPYTVYFNEADVVKFKINSAGEYTGIGASISRKEGKIIIKEIFKDYAADKAGLKAGDEITHVGDINLEDYKEDTSQLLTGAKNTVIPIQYKRQHKTHTAKITLDAIELKAVPFYAKINENTGYIVLSQFNAKASRETQFALEELKSQGATQIILDVRGNPGGLLGEAVNICNLFVDKGEVITTTKSRIDKHNNTYVTMREPVDTEIALAILIDGRSASASEIVAGALQDLDRAVVIGSRSFGKGLVQRPIDLPYGTQVKVTISRYYTPSGRCIQALDYSHRDKQGNAIRTDAKNYNAFKTRKGRTVYDGGGVSPDIELEESKLSPITQAIVAQDELFNFATDYFYKHPTSGDKIPNINDTDFNEFKNWLKKENFSYGTETQKALEKTLEAAQKEKIDKDIVAQYEALLQALKKSNETELNKNKEEIKRLLTDELVIRYQYREGLYNYYLKSNTEIKKAVQILNDKAQYNRILKK
ncbi:MAG TPA: S41 family peptidase [Flavobacterium sp.]|nr:S41 family peptidase [Flavobacterium sp.]